jgi:6-phosphogluconolactonase
VNEPLGELRVSRDAGEAQQACARFLENVIADIVAQGRRASIAVSGGNTPKATYEQLATSTRIAWDALDIFFADERCVPPEHPDSNYRMARAAFGPKARLVRMEAERPDREGAAGDYEKRLPRALDLVLLGMGPDGHTASLFPRHSALHSERRVLFVKDSPKPPPERLTIGPVVIDGARQLVVLVTGKDKAETLGRAREETTRIEDVPARLARRGTWFVDEAATGAHRLG